MTLLGEFCKSGSQLAAEILTSSLVSHFFYDREQFLLKDQVCHNISDFNDSQQHASDL